MEKFTVHTGRAVPLRYSNVDTDQIIPAVYLKRVTRTGFEDGLFAAWRTDPDFVLNKPEYKDGTILIAGPDDSEIGDKVVIGVDERERPATVLRITPQGYRALVFDG